MRLVVGTEGKAHAPCTCDWLGVRGGGAWAADGVGVEDAAELRDEEGLVLVVGDRPGEIQEDLGVLRAGPWRP